MILNFNARRIPGLCRVIPFVLFVFQVNALSAATSYPTPDLPSSIVSAPFITSSSDYHVAVASVGLMQSQLTIFLNDGLGNFTQGAQYTIEATTGVIAATAQFVDTDFDIVVVTNSNNLYFFKGNGDGTFTSPVVYSVPGRSPIGLALGNFTGTTLGNWPDIAIANSADSSVAIFENQGGGTFNSLPLFSLAAPPTAIAAGNIDQNDNFNGLDSLVVAYGMSDNIEVYLNQTVAAGTPIFNINGTYSVGTFPTCVLVADFNLGGYPDIAVGNGRSNNVSVLLNKGMSNPGQFNSSVNYPVNFGPAALAFLPEGVFTAATNNRSIAVACQAQSVVSILLNDGSGNFTAAPAQCAGSGPTSITANLFINTEMVDSIAVANITGSTFSFITPVNMVQNCSPLFASVKGALQSLLSPKPEFLRMLCHDAPCSRNFIHNRNSRL